MYLIYTQLEDSLGKIAIINKYLEIEGNVHTHAQQRSSYYQLRETNEK